MPKISFAACTTILILSVKPVVFTPGPGEPQGVLVFVVTRHVIVRLKQLITQLTRLTWFLGSESVAHIKVKTKTSSPCGSPGPGVKTAGLNSQSHSLCFPTVPDLSGSFLLVPFSSLTLLVASAYDIFLFTLVLSISDSFILLSHCFAPASWLPPECKQTACYTVSSLPSHTSCICSSLSYKLLPRAHILGTNNISMAPFQILSPYSSHNLNTPSPVVPLQIQLILTNYPALFLLYGFSATSPHKLPPPPEIILPPHQ